MSSQERASRQSLMTVSGETFRTSAVSSTLSPAKAELHDLRFSRIELGERVERVIQVDDFRGPIRSHFEGIVQIQPDLKLFPHS